MAAERALRLLQGYIWYPKDEDIDLGDYLPRELEPGIHLLWDEVRPPFTFFDDGTFAASQHIYQFTALKIVSEEDEAEAAGLLPWLAETLQKRLEASPPSVGWQVLDDLREL